MFKKFTVYTGKDFTSSKEVAIKKQQSFPFH